MIVCKECKQTITHNNYYYVDMTNEYLCSDKCRLSYAKKEKEKEDKEYLYETIERIFNISFAFIKYLLSKGIVLITYYLIKVKCLRLKMWFPECNI